MRFSTAGDLRSLADQSALASLDDQQVESVGNVEFRKRHMLWELGEGNSLKAARYWQHYFVLGDGSARLGPEIHPPLAEFLALREEVQRRDDGAQTAQEIADAIRSHRVKRRRGERVTWLSIHAAIGVDRAVATRAELKAAGNAAANEILVLLDPLNNLGADPAVDEWDNQVDAMASLTNLTADEVTKIKAIGDVPWGERHGVVVRDWQVERLVS